MPLSHSIVLALWLGLIVLWAISATTAKRTIKRSPWRKEVGIRLLIVALIVIAWRTPSVRDALERVQFATHRNAALTWIGVALCAIGVGLAASARVQLGRNWGMPASLKENPDLVTAGPYRIVRHPIYSGLLIAMSGTVLAESILWLLPLVVSGFYFFVAARREERLMLEQFPEQYPAYMRRTKMLLPFVL
jgi:protein-S-isoprenylcysteine O-methyltransferase Ste14